MPKNKPLTIGIIAGEASGDALGADFMTQIKAIDPSVRFVGVGGEQMIQKGLASIIDIARLSVMGISEVIRHLPDLFAAKREILSAFDDKIDIFVGIDAPDFNLRLAKILKAKGVFCVHYVSPSIWAWRENRIHTIKKATDLVLCLFAFELPVYQKHAHPAVCVGHPLIKQLAPPKDDEYSHIKNALLSLTGTPKDATLLCLMAGSRNGEIAAILPSLLQSMAQITATHPNAHALLPLAYDEQKSLVQSLIDKNAPHLRQRLRILTPSDYPHTLTISQMAMSISDVTLIASGTATLEAALLNSAMVVVYKVSPATYHIAKRLIRIPYVSLPNLLSHHLFDKAVVPELIQDNATPSAICQHALGLIKDPSTQKQSLAHLTSTLGQTSKTNPAAAVLTAYQDSR